MELFGENNVVFLKDEMWLDLLYIQKEIETKSVEYSNFFNAMFTWMNKYYIFYKDICNKEPIERHPKIREIIYKHYNKIIEKYNMNSEYYVATEILHCYTSFCMGGIEDAWLYSEKSEWYPKIIFKERIASDIDELDEVITIYRGTSQDEFNSQQFGQSWTLSKGIARSFAFTKYKGSSRLYNTKRVLLETKVSRNDVLYYKKVTTAMEDEIIINVDKLEKVVVKEFKNWW